MQLQNFEIFRNNLPPSCISPCFLKSSPLETMSALSIESLHRFLLFIFSVVAASKALPKAQKKSPMRKSYETKENAIKFFTRQRNSWSCSAECLLENSWSHTSVFRQGVFPFSFFFGGWNLFGKNLMHSKVFHFVAPFFFRRFQVSICASESTFHLQDGAQFRVLFVFFSVFLVLISLKCMFYLCWPGGQFWLGLKFHIIRCCRDCYNPHAIIVCCEENISVI